MLMNGKEVTNLIINGEVFKKYYMASDEKDALNYNKAHKNIPILYSFPEGVHSSSSNSGTDTTLEVDGKKIDMMRIDKSNFIDSYIGRYGEVSRTRGTDYDGKPYALVAGPVYPDSWFAGSSASGADSMNGKIPVGAKVKVVGEIRWNKNIQERYWSLIEVTENCTIGTTTIYKGWRYWIPAEDLSFE